MFTKEDLTKMFKKNKKKNFIISTNISVGHGINGVSFSTFYGKYEWKDRNSYEETKLFDDSTILEFADNYIVLKNIVRNYEKTGEFIRYIPYDNIVGISFIEESPRFGNTL